MAATQTTETITWRKTKRGEWVAYGPAKVVRKGREIMIAKRSGECTRHRVERVGRPFTSDSGERMVYGYVGDRIVYLTDFGSAEEADAYFAEEFRRERAAAARRAKRERAPRRRPGECSWCGEEPITLNPTHCWECGVPLD